MSRHYLLVVTLITFVAFQVNGNSDHSYCNFTPNHTMCRFSGIGERCGQHIPMRGLSQSEIQLILNEHNAYRSRIAMGQEGRGISTPQPPAANMLAMTWDPELANIAQRHADQCTFSHDCGSCRKTDRFAVGQNLYITFSSYNEKREWSRGIRSWYDEVADWDPKHNKPFVFSSPLGHYTQMAWWNTRSIGCGMTMFNEDGWWKKLYTCNYGPTGNVIGTEMYKEGKPCSTCPEGTSCSDKFPGICEIDQNALSFGGNFHTDNAIGLSFEEFDFFQRFPGSHKSQVKTNVQVLNLEPDGNLLQNQMQELIKKLRSENHNNVPHILNVSLKKIDRNTGKETNSNFVLRPNRPGLTTVTNMHPISGLRDMQNIPFPLLKMLSPIQGMPQQLPLQFQTGHGSLTNKRPQPVSNVRGVTNSINKNPRNMPPTSGIPNVSKNFIPIENQIISLPINGNRGERSRLIIGQNGEVLEVIQFGPNAANTFASFQENQTPKIEITNDPSLMQHPHTLEMETTPTRFSPLQDGNQIYTKPPNPDKNSPELINQINSRSFERPATKETLFGNLESTRSTDSSQNRRLVDIVPTKDLPTLLPNSIDASTFDLNEAITIPAAVMQLLPQQVRLAIKRLKELYEKGHINFPLKEINMPNTNPTMETTRKLKEDDFSSQVTPEVFNEPNQLATNGGIKNNFQENVPIEVTHAVFHVERHATLSQDSEMGNKEKDNNDNAQVNVEEAISAIEKGAKIPNSQILRTSSVNGLRRILQNVPEGVEPLVLYRSPNGELVQIDPEKLHSLGN